MGYKEMSQARTFKSLTLKEAVSATVASMAGEFRKILGSEPIVEVIRDPSGQRYRYILSTYGAGSYKQVAEFYMSELPGCCGVVVFFHASVATDFRKIGLGGLLLHVRQEAAIKAGYSIAQATVLKKNDAELSLLRAAEWEAVGEFKNARTNNEVVVLIKTLNRS